MVQLSSAGRPVNYFFWSASSLRYFQLHTPGATSVQTFRKTGPVGGGAVFLRRWRRGNRCHRLAILDTGPWCLVAELVGLFISLASGEWVVSDTLRLLQIGHVE
jgi:hypothetical protein